MTRRIVSFTPSGPYVFRNVRRTTQNNPLIMMEGGEQTSVLFDLTNYLDTGETITATNVGAHGSIPTLTTNAAGTQVTASNITPTNGYSILTFTTSQGEKIATKLYVAERCTSIHSDYHHAGV